LTKRRSDTGEESLEGGSRSLPVPGVTAAIEHRIYLIRGVRVLLDEDLAALYGVSTGRLNEAVGRNVSRFPDDFMFRLTAEEAAALKSQSAISKDGRGGRRRSNPRAFTEQGVAMLSSVLRSRHAIAVNTLIMRAFVRLRYAYGQYDEVRRLLTGLTRRVGAHDDILDQILGALEALSRPATTEAIGFRARPGSTSEPGDRKRRSHGQ